MNQPKLDLLQGTLDLMVLQALSVMGSMHGYGLARRIEQVSGDQILLNRDDLRFACAAAGTRLDLGGVGTSGNNRKAKFYTITAAGREQLAADLAYWERLVDVMVRVVSMKAEAEAQ